MLLSLINRQERRLKFVKYSLIILKNVKTPSLIPTMYSNQVNFLVNRKMKHGQMRLLASLTMTISHTTLLITKKVYHSERKSTTNCRHQRYPRSDCNVSHNRKEKINRK